MAYKVLRACNWHAFRGIHLCQMRKIGKILEELRPPSTILQKISLDHSKWNDEHIIAGIETDIVFRRKRPSPLNRRTLLLKVNITMR
jgi:hypothetical protein